MLNRRQALGLLALGPAMAAFGGPNVLSAERRLPIVFVHGNGDTAGLWITTIWRFESNGYPRSLMHAVDLRYPLARTKDDTPQEGRSSTADAMQQLAQEVAMVRKRTGAPKVILVAQSRGGNTVRNYIKNGGGAAVVQTAILCGCVNHGVVVSDKVLVGSEFNGASPFMRDLNSTPGEVVPGVRFFTIRSDKNDKFAQTDGKVFGLPGPTGLSYDAPELKGATNIVLPGIDHRETGYAPEAFAAMYRAITGHDPAMLDIAVEKHAVLAGKVSGFEAGAQTNIGVAGASVEIYEVSPKTGERRGRAVHSKKTGADGQWGPFEVGPDAYYEFVVGVPGNPITHIYRSPFARSSGYVNIRPQPFGKGDSEAGAVVYMSRPRGYYTPGRDVVLLDGQVPAAIPPGVGTISLVKVNAAAPSRSVEGIVNQEGIVARTWPVKENRVSVIELTY